MRFAYLYSDIQLSLIVKDPNIVNEELTFDYQNFPIGI